MFKFIKNALGSKETKNNNLLSLSAPLEGEIISITDVPDPVFSEKMMGDGFAINPTLGTIISPINGEVKSIFPTKHAIGLQSVEGYEIIIHFGLDTVKLKGEGFQVIVREGQKVNVGDTLLKVEIEGIKNKVPSIITPIVISNLKENESVVIEKYGQVSLGEKNIAIVRKNN